LIVKNLADAKADVFIFEPGHWAPTSGNPEQVKLTKPRALLLALMYQYRRLGYDISLLEIQKLAYFLHIMGQQDLKLNCKKFYYGPYAHNLQHLLHLLEKKYLIVDKPIIDSRPFDIIYTRKELCQEVFEYVEKNCSEEEKERFEMIKNLIKGYESPFGLELLATVEWVIQDKKNSTQLSPEIITSEIQNWSKRKSESFTPELIENAITHLNKTKNKATF